MTVKTIGDLIKALEGLPPETKIISQSSNTMEIGNELELGAYVEVDKYEEYKKPCRDAFDGCSYIATLLHYNMTADVYRKSEDGESFLVIR